jgi:hypothetical protein
MKKLLYNIKNKKFYMTAKEKWEKAKDFLVSLFSEQVDTSVDTSVDTAVDTSDTKPAEVEAVKTVTITADEKTKYDEISKLYEEMKGELEKKELLVKDLENKNKELSKKPISTPTNLEGKEIELSYAQKMIEKTKKIREAKGLSY